MDVEVVSDQESVESSSSDDSEVEEEAERAGGDEGGIVGTESSSRIWETTPSSDGDRSDGELEMASVVASAGRQARKFLEDSDSEEEMKDGNSATDLQNVFGEEGDEEDTISPVRAKRGLSSESDQEAPAKRIRVDSAEENRREVIQLDSDEEGPANKEVVGLDSDEEEVPTNKEVIGLDSDEEGPANKEVIGLDSDEEEEFPANKEVIGLDSDEEEVPANKEVIGLDSGEEEVPANKEVIGLDSGEEEVPANKEVIGLGSDEEVPANKEVDSDEEAPANKEGAESGEEGGGVVLLQEEVAEVGAGEVEEEEGEGEGEEEPDSDEGDEDRKVLEGPSDWDVMMDHRKDAMARARMRRKKRDGDLTVNDDHIVALIDQMREAAREDRQLNIAHKAATKKIQLLPIIMGHLKKADLLTTLRQNGILTALAEWLTPLPDHSLPHLKIRESILDILKTFPIPDSDILKSSRIGKAIMLLYRHPKEAKKNKEKAGKIISDWARPIFGLASDFKSMSRNEREERDYANLSQEARQRISTGERRSSQDDETEPPQKPGDKGWIGRARVPMPSTKGYVVRPKWSTDQVSQGRSSSSKKPLDRYEKHLRKKKQEKMQNKTTHAVAISVEGRHMPL